MTDHNQYEINRDHIPQSENKVPYDIEYGPGLQEIPEVEKMPQQKYVPDLDSDVNGGIDSFIIEQEKIDKQRKGSDIPN